MKQKMVIKIKKLLEKLAQNHHNIFDMVMFIIIVIYAILVVVVLEFIYKILNLNYSEKQIVSSGSGIFTLTLCYIGISQKNSVLYIRSKLKRILLFLGAIVIVIFISFIF